MFPEGTLGGLLVFAEGGGREGGGKDTAIEGLLRIALARHLGAFGIGAPEGTFSLQRRVTQGMMAIAMPDPSATRAPSVAGASELDRATLAGCRAQDPRAFRAFVVRYERAVFACLSRMLGRGPHVEDLAQEVFLRAFRAMPSFNLDALAKPSTWLLTIATRAALDVRKRRVVPIRPLDEGAEVAHAVTPETSLARTELGRAIERAAAQLPDDQRAALVLGEYHGFSVAEIAAAMGIPEATAKTRLFRAREKMRASLGDAWEER
jgi:RNA polymerase sigma-70 factor (ECF subfamily)